MRKIFLKMILFYQEKISPKFPARCRFYPSCSSYAFTAIERFGVFRGTILALLRILRCNQLFKGGIDYVPQEFSIFYRRKNK